jgi:hypothetical protein
VIWGKKTAKKKVRKAKKKVAKKLHVETRRKHTRGGASKRTTWTADPRDVQSARDMERGN